jgi:hypothetical protein
VVCEKYNEAAKPPLILISCRIIRIIGLRDQGMDTQDPSRDGKWEPYGKYPDRISMLVN